MDTIHKFHALTRGSWRNAIYVLCPVCPYGRENCGGHLLIADRDGAPVLLSVSRFQKATGQTVDPGECAAVLPRQAFEALYDAWLLWQVDDPKRCCILQLPP